MVIRQNTKEARPERATLRPRGGVTPAQDDLHLRMRKLRLPVSVFVLCSEDTLRKRASQARPERANLGAMV